MGGGVGESAAHTAALRDVAADGTLRHSCSLQQEALMVVLGMSRSAAALPPYGPCWCAGVAMKQRPPTYPATRAGCWRRHWGRECVDGNVAAGGTLRHSCGLQQGPVPAVAGMAECAGALLHCFLSCGSQRSLESAAGSWCSVREAQLWRPSGGRR